MSIKKKNILITCTNKIRKHTKSIYVPAYVLIINNAQFILFKKVFEFTNSILCRKITQKVETVQITKNNNTSLYKNFCVKYFWKAYTQYLLQF